MINYQIGVDQYGLEDTDLISFLNTHLHKFPVVQHGFRITRDGLPDFIREHCSLEWKCYDFHSLNGCFIAIGEQSAVLCRHKKSVSIYGKTYASVVAIVNLLNHFFQNTKDEIVIEAFFKTQHGIDSTKITVSSESIGPIHSELYPDIDLKKLTDAYHAAQAKILILHGEPGTGKTTFIKSFITSNEYPRIAYTKDLQAMSSDDFWISLHDNEPNLLILDDLDAELARNGECPVIDKLLTFSDGILINSTKIIITTNRPIKDIDDALIRPGRCFDCIELNTLTHKQALSIWTGLLGNTQENFNTAETKISQAALMSMHLVANGDVDRGYMKVKQDIGALKRTGF